MRTRWEPLVAGMLLATVGTGLGQPTITTQPQNQTNAFGTTATFSVEATGTEPLAYQWRKDLGAGFEDQADRTNSTLVLGNVHLSDAVDYCVVVSNPEGAVTSIVAHLYMPPYIMSSVWQPTNWPVVSVGASVGNRVTASGSAPLAYQWCFNGAPIPGRTKSSILLSNVQLSDAGDYTAVVTNMVGSVTSRVVPLKVVPEYFQDVTTSAGITNAPGYCISAAWGDYDNDELIDLYLAIGANQSRVNALFRNNGNGTFTRVWCGGRAHQYGRRCFLGLRVDRLQQRRLA